MKSFLYLEITGNGNGLTKMTYSKFSLALRNPTCFLTFVHGNDTVFFWANSVELAQNKLVSDKMQGTEKQLLCGACSGSFLFYKDFLRVFLVKLLLVMT